MISEEYMLQAIELAKLGQGFTNPNPMVGAVIVKDGRVIGSGYHKKCGDLHAERNAIASLTESAQGATIYVTLEPCCHHGKTPPCTEAIIEAGISRVVIGSRDPNPLVAGKGVKILRNAGIEVVEDFMREECDGLNDIFFHYITTKRPYVIMKYAMTLDGKIATKTGASKWISNEDSRKRVHRMRHNCMAIMAGIGTVLADDPMLNVRIEGLKSPVRVICDSKLGIPLDSKLVKTATEYRTIIACGIDNPNETQQLKIKALELAQVEIVFLPDGDGRVDLDKLMAYLGDQGIDSVLVEGGAILNDGLLRAGLVNEIRAFVAPKIFGGTCARNPVEGLGVESVDQASVFRLCDVERIQDDLMITYKREICLQES